MKNKIRIYELAKELDLKSKFVVEFLHDLGADVANHMSSIDEDIANMLREHFAPEEEAPLVEEVDEEIKVVKKKRRSFKRKRIAMMPRSCGPRRRLPPRKASPQDSNLLRRSPDASP